MHFFIQFEHFDITSMNKCEACEAIMINISHNFTKMLDKMDHRNKMKVNVKD